MSPLLVVFAPVLIGCVAFVALILGAAAAGSCESIGDVVNPAPEGHAPVPSSTTVVSRIGPPAPTRARAA